MSWISLILAVLKLISSIVVWARERQLLQAGQDQAIAQASLQVLAATASGHELRQRIEAMTDPEAEELWRRMIEDGG